jgi:hypothetical protein
MILNYTNYTKLYNSYELFKLYELYKLFELYKIIWNVIMIVKLTKETITPQNKMWQTERNVKHNNK